MKKTVSLLLALLLLLSCVPALAETPALPSTEIFATMATRREKCEKALPWIVYTDMLRITLSKPVDKLYINYPNELRVYELSLNDNLTTVVYIGEQNTQAGVRWVGTLHDRAFVTVQGEWIVCYNRQGDLVNVTYGGPSIDIQAIRDVAFARF